LVDAYIKSPAPVSTLHAKIVEALTAVASDLKEKPDAEQDNMDRLAVVGRVLQMFSLEELKSLWQEIKDQDFVVMSVCPN
jgi:lipopolysaccharide/colanic/teichoic acid biosynthesis glycosyltransferase